MKTKKKNKLTRVVALILSIMLLAYQLPIQLFQHAYAQTANDSKVFTLQVKNEGVPVTETEVLASNADITFEETVTTDTNGIATFPELTKAKFGENNTFEFVVDSKSFTLNVTEGTTDYYVYDLSTEQVDKMYYVTVNGSGEGSGTVKINGTDYENPVQMKEDSSVEVDIIPAIDSDIVEVKLDGVDQTGFEKDHFTKTIDSLTADTTIEVVFAKKNYTITFPNFESECGTIKVNNTEIENNVISVQHGNDVSFTVEPSPKYYVESVKKVDGESKSDVKKENDIYIIPNVTSHHEIEVTFAINTYEVTAAVDGENGTVEVNKSTVDHGEDVTVTITPETNEYRLSSFMVNDTPIPVNTKTKDFTEDDHNVLTYTVRNVEEKTHITAVFEHVSVLEGEVDSYVNIEPTSGSLVNQYKEENHDIRVYSKDTKLDISAIEPNDKVSFFEDRLQWKDVYNIEKSTLIEKVFVKKNNAINTVEIDLNNKLLLVMDQAKPVVKKATLSGPNEVEVDNAVWYSGAVTVSGQIDNVEETFEGISYSTEIEKVYYSKGEYSPKAALEADFDAVNNVYSFETVDEDYKGIYSIWAVDQAGNISEVQTVEVNIDKTNPTLADGEAVTFVQENNDFFSKALNFLTFGTYFNKQIEVTVKVKDDASGIQSISLIPSDEKIKLELVEGSFKKDGLTAEAKFIIPKAEFTGSFTVEVTDNVTNAKSYLVTKDNSNIVADDSGIIMLEQGAPSVSIDVTPKENVSSNGGNQYNGDVTYTITAQDTETGVNTVVLNVNGTRYEYDYSDSSTNNTEPISYSISTDDEGIQINKDGSYHVTAYVIDHAGNTNEKEIITYKDETNPVITDFIFANKDETQDIVESVELTEYGFYFKKPTKVTIKADDPVVEYEYTSKVKSLTVYLKDHDNGKYYAVLSNGSLKEITEAQIDSIAPVATKKDITFNIPANFKGQIFAKATDNVNNTGKFATPDGTVIESNEKHLTETHIDFEKADATYTDNNNLELYPNNVDVKLTVTDTYSGIGEIEWSVIAPYDTANNQSGSIKINNDKTYAEGSNSEGWKQTRIEKNLVTEMTKTITVSNNSNDIKLKVKMTDRSGNTSEDEIVFSIDKTTPTIEVSYDNNTQDPQFADVYNADRTATITVTERNFRAQDVVETITNTDGIIPRLVGWTTVPNRQNPDETMHIAKISYTADGDYTFNIAYKDNAGNVAPAYTQDTFTIDKTDPVINVSYNNNDASAGNYYKEARTATISITEHNFETSRVKVTGVATDGGTPIAYPAVSAWRTNGDVHTATISYTADAKYSFDIEYTDKAGNNAEDYTMDEFIIDQTAPVLEITGVEDKSANNGKVAPIVSYSDTNFNKDHVSIQLKGANKGPAKLNGSFSDTANGQVYTFKDFEKVKENDDIYTLTATVVDFAGNETSETITFSVNRFGSVYVFDESLKNIEGKFVNKEIDVVVTETNVDSLISETIKVKMTKNGTPTDLVEDKDYTVKKSGGNGKWSQYTYVVDKSLFAGDGRYTVSLHSKDAAGNINENINETKEAEISFGMDKTAPVVVPIDIESGEQYPVDSKPVTITINDNLVLDDATIYLNGKEVEYEVDGENYTFNVSSSNSKQNIKIVAVDAAGNEHNQEINDFLVTTNLFVRWYNNTPVFIGSIAGVTTLGIALATYFLFFRKKKAVDENLEEE